MNEFELVDHLKIKYMNIFLVELKYRTPHYHFELELGMVLRGSLKIKKGGQPFLLHVNDIFVMNPGEPHELFAEDENVLILAVQLSYKLFSAYFPPIKTLKFLEFDLHNHVPQKIYQESLSHMLQLAILYFKQRPLYEFQCIIIANKLVLTLLENLPYKIPSHAELEISNRRFRRLTRIVDYVEENYNRKLLLQEIADIEELSLTYLSHFVKDMLGITFQDYLNQVRLDNAVHLIETTNRNMLDICLESGFSDIRYLNKFFSLRYGCTPKQYCKSYDRTGKGTGHYTASHQQMISLKESLRILSDHDPRNVD